METRSESILLELSVERSNLLVAHGLGASSLLLLLESVELLGLGLAVLFELLDKALLGPASDNSEVAEAAVFTVRLQSEHLEGFGNNDALLVVVGEGNTLEDLQATESGGALGGLVGQHSTDHLPEDAGGSFPVFEAAARVGVNAVVHGLLTSELVAEEGAGNVNSLRADHNDALATDELLGNNTGKAAHEVAATINDNFLFEHA